MKNIEGFWMLLDSDEVLLARKLGCSFWQIRILHGESELKDGEETPAVELQLIVSFS